MNDPSVRQDLLQLNEEQASALFEQGKEAVVWALLQLSAMARQNAAMQPEAAGDGPDATPEQPIDPATPSAMIPPYRKQPGQRRRKKPGRKPGHEGARRPPAESIDEIVEHRLEVCPDCGRPVPPKQQFRLRYVEDVVRTRVTVTEHRIHQAWCRGCKKRVEPKVTKALPKSTIGNRALALSAWLHYGLGNTASQVCDVFNALFHFPVSAGGFAQMWGRLAAILEPWHEQIKREASASAVLHADETGWRVNGQTHWLWCFTNPSLTYYWIDPSRGSRVLTEFLGECFDGMLVSDFFSAYSAVAGKQRQVCLAHLLREIKKVSARDASEDWQAFAKQLKRFLKDALRLAAHPGRAKSAAADHDPRAHEKFLMLRFRLQQRLDAFCRSEHEHPDCARLVQRLARHRDSILEFLYNPAVPPDNNRAEREIRPAVIARKNSFHNMSEKGAKTQSILMSVHRTLKLRGRDPIETIADALETSIAAGILPPLPPAQPPET